MNTQTQTLTLANVLNRFGDRVYVVNRTDDMTLSGVLAFIETARTKGLCDFNIAKLIQVDTPDGKVTMAQVMKRLTAGAGVPAVAVSKPYYHSTYKLPIQSFLWICSRL